MNHLYYGDNLNVLRESIRDESIDLIYLDPPFNSNANYNVLFRNQIGDKSQAQIEAFDDTWHWSIDAEQAFDEVIMSGHGNVAEMLRAMRSFLGENDMMAYLTMMAVRMIELHRVLKLTGSLYLHCDPTASHYLKILLDAIFKPENFRNEIIWCYEIGSRGKRAWGKKHDVILFYTKSDNYTFNVNEVRSPRKKTNMKMEIDENGKSWQVKIDKKSGKKYMYEVSKGTITPDWWTGIQQLNRSEKERLGYPTQKPVSLLERILNASSNPNDIVLDPFCGCGTTIHAAQKLGRQWIGIDVTHLAITLIEKRLRDAFPSIAFETHGTPKDLAGAIDLAERDKYQFQWWALSLLDAQPFGGKKKGADGGIDGFIYFKSDAKQVERIIISVKAGNNVSVPMVRDLKGVLEREKAPMGIFLTLTEPTRPMLEEAAKAGFYETPKGGRFPKIQIVTIKDLFDGRKPQLPGLNMGAAFKTAKIEETIAIQQKLF